MAIHPEFLYYHILQIIAMIDTSQFILGPPPLLLDCTHTKLVYFWIVFYYEVLHKWLNQLFQLCFQLRHLGVGT